MIPVELYETTMNPSTRRLAQVTLADAVAADAMFNILMSDRVEPRKQFIIATPRKSPTSTGTAEPTTGRRQSSLRPVHAPKHRDYGVPASCEL